jgi:hypothetical protein
VQGRQRTPHKSPTQLSGEWELDWDTVTVLESSRSRSGKTVLSSFKSTGPRLTSNIRYRGTFDVALLLRSTTPHNRWDTKVLYDEFAGSTSAERLEHDGGQCFVRGEVGWENKWRINVGKEVQLGRQVKVGVCAIGKTTFSSRPIALYLYSHSTSSNLTQGSTVLFHVRTGSWSWDKMRAHTE